DKAHDRRFTMVVRPDLREVRRIARRLFLQFGVEWASVAHLEERPETGPAGRCRLYVFRAGDVRAEWSPDRMVLVLLDRHHRLLLQKNLGAELVPIKAAA